MTLLRIQLAIFVKNLRSIFKKKALNSLQLQLEGYNLNTARVLAKLNFCVFFWLKPISFYLIYLQLKLKAIHRFTYEFFLFCLLILFFVNQLFNNRTEAKNLCFYNSYSVFLRWKEFRLSLS